MISSACWTKTNDVLRTLVPLRRRTWGKKSPSNDTVSDFSHKGQHTIDRQDERGAERGSGRRSSLKADKKGSLSVRPKLIGTVSKATLGKLLRDGVHGANAFPNALTFTILITMTWTELFTTKLSSVASQFSVLLWAARFLLLNARKYRIPAAV